MAKTTEEMVHILHNLAVYHDSMASQYETTEPQKAAAHADMAVTALSHAMAHHYGINRETGAPMKRPLYKGNRDNFRGMSDQLNRTAKWLKQRGVGKVRKEDVDAIKGDILTEVKHYQMRLQNDPTMNNRQRYYASLQKLKEFNQLTADFQP